ncbi:MAG TPA: hypothetical protein VF704_05750 [Allosphingosinicella sp.]|jgi:hypothetical protein
MLRPMIHKRGEHFAHDPARRGYAMVYRQDETNHCPGCGRTHWYVGRVSAECGFCATALPLQEVEYSWGGNQNAWRGRGALRPA